MNLASRPSYITNPDEQEECWTSILYMKYAYILATKSLSVNNAKELIGRKVEDQYLGCMNKTDTKSSARVKARVDPSEEDLISLCNILMKNKTNSAANAKRSHVLFHYNGHGVLPPNDQGEIFLVDKNNPVLCRPFPISKLKQYLNGPTMYVLDCSRSELLVSHLCTESTPQILPASTYDTIILGSCSRDDYLPNIEGLPLDIFTSCLTTPLKMAIRYFEVKNPFHLVNKDRNLYDEIPGTLVYITIDIILYRMIEILP